MKVADAGGLQAVGPGWFSRAFHLVYVFWDRNYATFEASERLLYKNQVLGVIQACMHAGALAYLLYSVFVQQSYLDLKVPAGNLRFLRSGLGMQDGVVANGTAALYCNDAARLLWNARVTSQALSPCRMWDGIDTIVPAETGTGVMWTTLVQLQYQTCKLCANVTAPPTAPPAISFVDYDLPGPAGTGHSAAAVEESAFTSLKLETFYLSGPEAMNLYIYHYASTDFAQPFAAGDATRLLYEGGSDVSEGFLLNKGGTVSRKLGTTATRVAAALAANPATAALLSLPSSSLTDAQISAVYTIYKQARQDRFTLKELLDAAEVDLDAVTDTAGIAGTYGALPDPGGAKFAGTFRRWGLMLEVRIRYSNVYSFWAPSPVKYYYTARRISSAEYATTENYLPQAGQTGRLKMLRDGVLVYFVQTGSVGQFSFYVIWVNLFSALGFFGIAQVILYFIGMYLTPADIRYEFQLLWESSRKPLHTKIIEIQEGLAREMQARTFESLTHI